MASRADAADLLKLFHTRRGHVRLESGHHSDQWMELDQLFQRPSELQPFVAELAGRLSSYGIDAVCGPLTGGALLAEMLARSLNCSFAYAERQSSNRQGLYPVDYRIPRALRDGIKGMRIAVVDDAISAGSAARATLAEVQACGAAPVVFGALILVGAQPQALASSKGIPLVGLIQLDSQIWSPDACPLCADHKPLTEITPV